MARACGRLGTRERERETATAHGSEITIPIQTTISPKLDVPSPRNKVPVKEEGFQFPTRSIAAGYRDASRSYTAAKLRGNVQATTASIFREVELLMCRCEYNCRVIVELLNLSYDWF